jgi:hypothetical protein
MLHLGDAVDAPLLFLALAGGAAVGAGGRELWKK